jgi:superoxide reductase
VDIFKRRDFLKGAGAIFLGHAFLDREIHAQEKEPDWFKTINRIADPNNMTATEKKHAPFISISSYIRPKQVFFVTIEVGSTPHVMTPNHWIRWIETYLGTHLVSRTELSPLSPQPSVTIPLCIEGPEVLKAMAQCNLHGIWESTRQLTPV